MMQRLLILTLLAGAAASSAWLLQWLSEEPGSIIADAKSPDYYMENFSALTMEEDGKPKNRLSAAYMAHYPHNDSTELLEPRMEIFRGDGLPLRLAAQQGRMDGNNDIILFKGAVTMWKQNEDGESTLQVKTSDARVFLDEEYAESDRYTTITTNSATITGVGVRAWLPEGRLEVVKHEKTTIKASSDR